MLLKVLLVLLLPCVSMAHGLDAERIVRKLDRIQNLLDQNRVYRAQSLIEDLRSEIYGQSGEDGNVFCFAQVQVTDPDRPKKAMSILVKAYGGTEEIAKTRITEKCMDRGGFSILVCKSGARSAECRIEN